MDSICGVKTTHVRHDDQIPPLVSQIEVLLTDDQCFQAQFQFVAGRLGLPNTYG